MYQYFSDATDTNGNQHWPDCPMLTQKTHDNSVSSSMYFTSSSRQQAYHITNTKDRRESKAAKKSKRKPKSKTEKNNFQNKSSLSSSEDASSSETSLNIKPACTCRKEIQKQESSTSITSSFCNKRIRKCDINKNCDMLLGNHIVYSDAEVSSCGVDEVNQIKLDVNAKQRNAKTAKENGYSSHILQNGNMCISNHYSHDNSNNLHKARNGISKNTQKYNETKNQSVESIGSLDSLSSDKLSNKHSSELAKHNISIRFNLTTCNTFTTVFSVLKKVLSNIITGVTLGLCVYVRVDISALIVTSLLPHWHPWNTKYYDIITALFGVTIGLSCGIAVDFWCFGYGIISPLNWFRFNVQNDYSGQLFGNHKTHKYLKDIFLYSFHH